MMRALENFYTDIPFSAPDRQTFVEASQNLRGAAISMKVRAEKISHPEIAALFGDFIKSLDHYADFYTELGLIDKAMEARATDDLEDSSKKALGAGALALGFSNQSLGMEPGDAALASVFFGGVTYLTDLWAKAEQRDEQKQLAISQARQRLSDTFLENTTRARHAAQELAASRGWGSSEIGWETSTAPNDSLARLQQKNNFKEAADILGAICRDRPRDFFALYERNLMLAKLYRDGESLILLASNFRDARSLVPPAAVYDNYRLNCLISAGYFATDATDRERREGKTSIGPSPISHRALLYWDELLKAVGPDSTGHFRLTYIYVLLDHGDFEEAKEVMIEVESLLKNDPSYQYALSCLLAQGQVWEESKKSLKYAMISGRISPNNVRTDPLLHPLKEHDPAAFKKIIDPRWSWKVTDDLLLDDIVLTNESPYPLTNVKVTVSLGKSGVDRQRMDLTCDSIAPGETHIWKDVVTGVSGEWDMSRCYFVLSCDQSE